MQTYIDERLVITWGGSGQRRLIGKGYIRACSNFWGCDGYIHYLNFGDIFTDV